MKRTTAALPPTQPLSQENPTQTRVSLVSSPRLLRRSPWKKITIFAITAAILLHAFAFLSLYSNSKPTPTQLVSDYISQVVSSNNPLSNTTTSTIKSNSKIYLLYRSFYGNFNNMLMIHRHMYNSVLKSSFRDRIVLVSGETPYNESIIEEYFQGYPDIQSITTREFFQMPEAKELIESGYIYVDDMIEYNRTIDQFFAHDRYYLKRNGIQMPGPRIMKLGYREGFKRLSRYCNYFSPYVDRALNSCMNGEEECKIVMLPAMFTNHENCTKEDPNIGRSTLAFRPRKMYQNILDKGMNAIKEKSKDGPVVAFHLRFLPMGFAKHLYKQGGEYKEGTLPNNMNATVFVDETLDTFQCLVDNNGWEYPKGIYLFGWPSLVEIFTPMFESRGLVVLSYDTVYTQIPEAEQILHSRQVQWFRAFIDEFTAVGVDYFISMWRSTLTLIVADYRRYTKGHESQFLPDMLPKFGPVYPGSMMSPCKEYDIKKIGHLIADQSKWAKPFVNK